MRLQFFLVCLLIAVELSGQETPKGVVEGTVVDEVTGEPVRRAGVTLTRLPPGRDSNSWFARCEPDGRFRFEGLAAGEYSLTARRNGYVEIESRISSVPLFLASQEHQTGLTLRLTPQGIVSGRVFDEVGDPVQGADVRILQRKKSRGKFSWSHRLALVTDDQGAYRAHGLVPGDYTVAASYTDITASSVADASPPRPLVYATTYYPSEIEADDAKAVSVRMGRTSEGVDLKLRMEQSGRVRVRVEGVPESMARTVFFDLTSSGAFPFHTSGGFLTRMLEPGLFQLEGIRSGSWKLQARIPRPGEEPLIGLTSIEVRAADRTDAVVRVSTGIAVAGTMIFERTSPAKSVWKNYTIRLVSSDDMRVQSSGNVAQDGSFTLPGSLPGKYRFEIQGPSQDSRAYLASIQVGGEEYLGRELDLSKGLPGPVKVIYRNDAASVNGKLDDDFRGAPKNLGMALLVPVEPQLRQLEYMSVTNIVPNGRFAFPPVRPGEYLLCHMEGDYQKVREEGGPPKEAMAGAERIKVEPGGNYTVQLNAMKSEVQP